MEMGYRQCRVILIELPSLDTELTGAILGLYDSICAHIEPSDGRTDFKFLAGKRPSPHCE
jgi:hypothetical protein